MADKESLLHKLLVPVVIALLAGGTSPWWWNELFGRDPTPPPVVEGDPGPAPDPDPQPQPQAPAPPRCAAVTRTVAPVSVATNASDLADRDGDTEIDSDDWTRVGVSYGMETRNGRALELVLTWHAQELNRNKSRGDTRFESKKRIPVFAIDAGCPDARILRTSGLTKRASKSHDFNGERHGFHAFPDTGSLVNLKVQFDAKGRKDHQVQALTGTLSGFQVEVSASP
jgi:hypothetical protein